MNMKYFIIFLLINFISCKKNQQMNSNNFSGSWEYESVNNKDEFQNKTFELELSNKNNIIVGTYCSISRGGRKIDCFDRFEKNITGIIQNDTLYLDFYSSWENSKGKAKLYFDNKSRLNWLLGECTGELYLPIKIALEKVKEN